MHAYLKDLFGEEVEVMSGIDTETGERGVWVGDYKFSPDDARRLSSMLVDAADDLRGFIALPGGITA